jgi:hypothetical protein
VRVVVAHRPGHLAHELDTGCLSAQQKGS